MDYTTANKIMAEIHLRRDWTIVWHRVNTTTMFVEIKGIVDDSSDYPNYAGRKIHTTEFVMHLDQIRTPMDLLNLLMTQLIVAATHEEREFLRVGSSWTAPFHPHTPLGQRNWSSIKRQLSVA